MSSLLRDSALETVFRPFPTYDLGMAPRSFGLISSAPRKGLLGASVLFLSCPCNSLQAGTYTSETGIEADKNGTQAPKRQEQNRRLAEGPGQLCFEQYESMSYLGVERMTWVGGGVETDEGHPPFLHHI